MTGEKQARKPWVIILIFAALIAYIIIVLITSFTKKNNATVYEVSRGTVSESLVLSGIILRDEEVFNASEDGNIEYYQSSGSKVKVGDVIYSLDKTGESSELLRELAGNGDEFSEDEKFQIHSLLSSYRTNYEAVGFEGLYDTKSGMSSIILNSVKDIISDTNSDLADTLKLFETEKAGYIVFSSDGNENLTIDDIGPDMFNRDRYKAAAAGIKNTIKAGECAYRLIRGDGWDIYCKLSPETVSDYNLEEVKAVTVSLPKAGATSRANFELIEKDGEVYALISLNKYVMNYARDRFADFEVSFGSDSGLQVPNSAIVTQDFYKIPRDYLTLGNNSNSEGFIVENESGAVFSEIEGEFKSSEHVFIKPGSLAKGTVLIKPDSDETFTVSETEPVKGVYLVNSGYAEFMAIDVISENKEYSVLNENTSGIKMYDRILLNSDGYNEGDVIY